MGTPALSPPLHLSLPLSHGAPPGYSGGDREQVTLAFSGDTLDFVHLAVSGDRVQLLAAQRGSAQIQPLIRKGGSSLKTPPPTVLHPAWAGPQGNQNNLFLCGLVLKSAVY